MNSSEESAGQRIRVSSRDVSRGSPAGARRRLLMEHLEPRTVLSNFVISGNVGNDVILLRRDPNNAALAQVRVNGVTLFNGPVAAGDTITLNGLSGNDTINIEDTFAGVTVTANGGNNDDTFNVSPTARFLDNLLGDVSVDGGERHRQAQHPRPEQPLPRHLHGVDHIRWTANASAPITYRRDRPSSTSTGAPAA